MHWWEDRVLSGVARYAAEQDWELDCWMRWTRSVPDLTGRRTDGLIVNVGLNHSLQSFAQGMHAAGVPIVGTQQVGDYPCATRVIVPHEAVGRAAAEHLLALNFTHFAFVFSEDNPMEHRRSGGFAAAVRAAGRSFWEIPQSQLAARLPGLPRPLGMMASNDLNAITAMRTCLDAGVRVPEECAIVGADDSELLCRFAPVPLSSVNCNFEAQGYAAAALLDQIMAGKEPQAGPAIIPPLGVTARRSTDTLAIPDLPTARALSFLRQHCCELIGISDVQAHTGAPLRRLQGGFRHYVGRTMSEELTRLRVEEAKRRLADRRLKMATVAEQCGFASRFHFGRAFLRVTGVTPKAFRARLRAGANED